MASGKLSKNGHHFRKYYDLKIDVIKKCHCKRCGPKFIFFNENKIRKIWMIIGIENGLGKPNSGTF